MKEGWEIKKLGEVCEYSQTRINSTVLSPDTYVGVENLLQNCQGKTSAAKVPDNVGLTRYIEGDVLLGNIRPYLKKIWLAKNCGGCNGDVLVIRRKEDFQRIINARYLFLCLSNDLFFEYDMRYSKGEKMPRGDKKEILNYPIPVPPLAEQERIVAELDCINGIIEKKKEQLKELDTLAQSIFYDMFGDPHYNKVWQNKPLIDLYKFIDYRGKTPSKTKVGIRLITARNVRFGYIDYTIDEYISEDEFLTRQSRGIAHKGDILFTTEAPMGYAAIADMETFSTGQRLITLQKRREIDINNIYMLYHLLSSSFQEELSRQATGATVKGIKGARLEKIEVPLPPLSLQQSFAAKVEAIEKQKQLIKQSIGEAETLLASRMDYYFN